MDTIARRSDLVEEILAEKAKNGLPVRDREREQAVLRSALAHGESRGVPSELV